MRPELFDLPLIHYGVKGYGFALMIGFLTAIYWASYRAAKVKASPDLILNMGFVALVFGVVGARLFYVLHYWQNRFAGRSWLSIVDVTAGGLEFYGGFLGAMVFLLAYMLSFGRKSIAGALAVIWSTLAALTLLVVYLRFAPNGSVVMLVIAAVIGFFVVRAFYRWARRTAQEKPVSIRLYLDIITPSLMWGLAFGRIGCFLNGCCWGAICNPAEVPWAVKFPCASPAEYDQWTLRQATLPAELINIDPHTGYAEPLHRDVLTMSQAKRERPQAQVEQAEKKVQELEAAGASQRRIDLAKRQLDIKRKILSAYAPLLVPLRTNAKLYGLTPDQLDQLARDPENKSRYVQPTQLYACVNAMLLSFVLVAIFHRRKRHGIVFGLLWILYPITRIVLETIRADNPLDTAGMTISQGVSVIGIAFGVIWLIAMYRLPLRSKYAVPYVHPEDREPAPKAKAAKA